MTGDGTRDFSGFVLGETADLVEVGRGAQVRAAAASMARQARRTLDIVTRDLDAPVYDDVDFLEAAKRLALRSGRTRVRILLQHVASPVARDHRLLALARRLSSSMQMRVPRPPYANYNSAFLVADGVGTIFRALADRYEAQVCFRNPREAAELTRLFDEMWSLAKVDLNLHTLKI